MHTITKDHENVFGNFIVSCETAGSVSPLALRDEPANRYQIDLSDYFTITYEKFSARLEKFGDLSRHSNATEEKELISLLETLINTKEMIRAKKEFGDKDGE